MRLESGLTSPAQSESRPDSRRSNQGRALRPFNDADFSHRLPTTGRHHAASAKVLKSSATQNSLSTANTPKGKKYTLASYKEFLRKGESYQEVFLHCEEQQALIDAQKSEIVDMQKSDASCQQQIKALEAEKATLTQNMKKFADMSSKYKTHMNEVVKAQKYLTSQAARIQKESSEILQARTIFDKIKKAIEEAKDHCKDPETSSSTCKLWHNRNRTKRLGRWFDCMDINLGWKERRRAIRIKNQLDYLTIERDTEQ